MAALPQFPKALADGSKIVPTTRSFTLGDYPTKTYRSLSGVIFKRAFGNKQTGYTLDLTFKNVKDAVAVAISKHYVDVDGTYGGFTMPDRTFNGMDNSLEALVQAPSGIKWRYAEPPKVQSVQPGFSTITVKLVGELSVS